MTEGRPPRKKPGPAPRYAPGKRPTLTFRVQEPLHERLRQTAAATGRSISEEVERRVEETFAVSDLINRMMNDIAYNVMEQLKKARAKPVDHDLALAIMESIASTERATRGFNSQLLHNEDGYFAKRVSAMFNVARDPNLEPSWKDEGDGMRMNERHPNYPNQGPPPATPPDGGPDLPPSNDLEATIKRAVIAALRETLPTSLTNRPATSEPREPPKVTPEASPVEQAAWTPIVVSNNPDELDQDGRPAKGRRKKPPAE